MKYISATHPKLPKQWRHWCNIANLRPISTWGLKKYNWYNLKGRGHFWRITWYGTFQRGDSYVEMDRWALCSDIKEVSIPKTQKEFLAAIKKMEEA